MRRCSGWRPVQVDWQHADAHLGHRPGECRVCWTPCRKMAERPVCDRCLAAWAGHPDPQVRLEAIHSFGALLGADMVNVLASDGDALVAEAAKHFLAATQQG